MVLLILHLDKNKNTSVVFKFDRSLQKINVTNKNKNKF